MAVGRLREGTNILAVPHSTSVSLEIPFNVEISKKSSLVTATWFFLTQSFRQRSMNMAVPYPDSDIT